VTLEPCSICKKPADRLYKGACAKCLLRENETLKAQLEEATKRGDHWAGIAHRELQALDNMKIRKEHYKELARQLAIQVRLGGLDL